ncbi:hypothetical protein ACFWMP_28270 [Paenibacillus sp. NPDC058367]|uniref:hypothetical protein n=1 Tax=Paenibacillus sp. NPDC058367 TaxID=3346460 RepID=UPI003649A02A
MGDSAKLFRTGKLKATKYASMKALFTLIDDEGRTEAADTYLKGLLDAKSWIAGVAIITDNVGTGDYKSWS